MDSLLIIFNTKEIETDNILLTQDTIIKNKTIRLQKVLIYSAIIILMMIILITFIILKNRNKLKSAYNLLSQKNNEIMLYSEELKTTNEKLTELDNFKVGLTNMIVHDLKNPLSVILNDLSIKNNVTVLNSANRMKFMVLNILDIQKYEDNKMIIDYSLVSVFEVINYSINELKFFISDKNLTINQNIEKDFLLKTDKQIFERVLLNILSNAIKFSPFNEAISINVTKQSSVIRFEIIDKGIGIEKQFHDLIFEKFGQIKAKEQGQISSTGLGLAFCKIAIESQGGRIGVISEINCGSTFWFEMPITETQILDNNSKEIIQISNSIFLFNDFEIETLSIFIKQLEVIEIYKVSEIRAVINQIPNDTEKIQEWKQLLTKALMSQNIDLYNKLIQLK